MQARLGVDAIYVSRHRLRPIATELIQPTRRDQVDPALQYLRQHAPGDVPSQPDVP